MFFLCIKFCIRVSCRSDRQEIETGGRRDRLARNFLFQLFVNIVNKKKLVP